MATKAASKRDELAALALARGLSYSEAAAESAMSERTVCRRMAEPGFRERVKELRAGIVDTLAGRLAAGGASGVDTLMELLQTPTPPAVRLGAARSLIELAHKLRETVELEERISELERFAHDRKHETPA